MSASTRPAQRMQPLLDRRGFIVTAGAVAALGALPLRGSAADGMARVSAGLSDWSVDDMWTGYPRPSQRIRYGRLAPALVPAPARDAAATGHDPQLEFYKID